MDSITQPSGRTTLKLSELREILASRAALLQLFKSSDWTDEQQHELESIFSQAVSSATYCADDFDIHPLLRSVRGVVELAKGVSPDLHMSLAMLLSPLCSAGIISDSDVLERWGDDVARLVTGLQKVESLYRHHASAKDENFRNLMLAFAEDIRVIIIMIVDRLVLMRTINHNEREELVRETAVEAQYLYAPLAHRLGLYKIKGELEDLSLKYTDRAMFTRIAGKLSATKVKRDAYIKSFISPVKAALEAQGLKFDIKGRTKSIYSIWNKMRKQHCDVENIYDLFAIRIILDVPLERERAECWMAFSIITSMFQPNPARMKDWLSVPKSNGYESLHTTVLGPEDKWVEVQIRTRRMDEIAETGIAAHWKYKGIKSESNLDTWMNQVRDILETSDGGHMELMKNLKADMYNNEVYAFTPRGDLYKLPLGATVLDFAFAIHSKLGCSCVGARVNGLSKKLNFKIQSGDTVEILTSSNQTPKLDWLGMVVTSKARNKIRQTINEQNNRAGELAKELLLRRFKNRKIEVEEGTLMKVIKKLGYKTVTVFYQAIGQEMLDVNSVIAEYERLSAADSQPVDRTSANEFEFQSTLDDGDDLSSASDVLIIGDNVKGMNYKLAKCCNPINGDSVFGFVSAEGVIKIHRKDCPNAANIRERYPYRLINVRWSGKSGGQYVQTLKVVGIDDIGIVTNISSIINKEKGAALRSISIDSHDGLFHGYLIIGVDSTEILKNVIRKINTIKGVKDVQRSN